VLNISSPAEILLACQEWALFLYVSLTTQFKKPGFCIHHSHFTSILGGLVSAGSHIIRSGGKNEEV
jgi:hypothetical protein